MQINRLMDGQFQNIVVDCDEVLVNITPKWYKKIMDSYHIFKDYFKDLGSLKEYDIINRDHYYLNTWLKHDHIENVPHEIILEMLKLYSEDLEFYDDLKITNFGHSIQYLIEHPTLLNKLYILTHSLSENNIFSKDKFLLRNFDSSKVEIIHIDIQTCKAKFLIEKEINPDLLVDDSPKVLKSYIENFQDKTILHPKMNYNLILEDELELSHLTNHIFAYNNIL